MSPEQMVLELLQLKLMAPQHCPFQKLAMSLPFPGLGIRILFLQIRIKIQLNSVTLNFVKKIHHEEFAMIRLPSPPTIEFSTPNFNSIFIDFNKISITVFTISMHF